MSGKLFIVSAPSGAGKTTLVDEVLGRLRPNYSIDRLVTYTSRAKRDGEEDGKDFHFISSLEFEMKIKNGFFIEWSNEYGHYYGSPSNVKGDLYKGDSKILVIDRKGAKQVIEQLSDSILIWIYTKNAAILRQRLVARGLNTEEQIEARLKLAKVELEQEAKNPFYRHHILNDIFDNAANNLELIFLNEFANFKGNL